MPFALISCDVFNTELAWLTKGSTPWVAHQTIAMAMHDQPQLLRAEIQRMIQQLQTIDGVDTIVLLYGLCGTALVGVYADSTPLVIPRSHDCLGILLGGGEAEITYRQNHPQHYIYTPGWVREKRVPGPDRHHALREQYAEQFADDPDMIEDLIAADSETFSHYHTAAYVDLTNDHDCQNYCRNCAQHLDWSFVEVQGDPALLQALIAENWDQQWFQTIAPGHQIALSNDQNVLTSLPHTPI